MADVSNIVKTRSSPQSVHSLNYEFKKEGYLPLVYIQLLAFEKQLPSLNTAQANNRMLADKESKTATSRISCMSPEVPALGEKLQCAEDRQPGDFSERRCIGRKLISWGQQVVDEEK